jgi:PLP dependent protein
MQFMNQTSDAIASNLFRVRQSIAEAARRAGRKPEDVRLIAVSKNHSHEAVAAAIACGHKDFGESTAQEAVPKISHLANKFITWHFIGHLQTNKAKFIPGNFSWLHSLDNPALARKLSRLARERSANINILIEVNVGRDPRKHGVAPEALEGFVERLLKEDLPALSWRGLMAIGPHAAPEKEIRRCFADLRELRDACARRLALPGFTELSMGMSGDFTEAIREGATMVRIGTALFGDRDYSRK